MIGSFKKVLDNMEHGVYDFTKDGKCSGCGKCCSALLPLSLKEVKQIKKYIETNNIKPHNHMKGSPSNDIALDLTCPFLDNMKHDKKCDIYEVRPQICREFCCNQKPSEIDRRKELFHTRHTVVYMWDLFKK